MITAFQVILLIVIVVSAIGTAGEKKDKKLQENMMFLGSMAIVAFIAAAVWL